MRRRRKKLKSVHLREGARIDRLTELSDIPRNPHEAVRKARREIQKLGYKITYYPGLFKFGHRWSTTFSRKIYLCADFQSWESPAQAEVLWHELYHITQRLRMGHFRFVWRWLFDLRWRWALEVGAFRVSMYVHEKFGSSAKRLRRIAAVYVDVLWHNYKLKRKLDYDQFREQTDKILLSK